MDSKLFREQVRRLVFAAPRLSEALLSGNFRSVFKGRGMDFESLREYEIDDDALRIDWNASARFGKPFVKTYKEDRDLNLFIILDESSSMNFGTGRSKRETAVLASSILAYTASLQGIAVGALCFGTSTKMDVIAPAQGEGHARMLMERLATEKRQASLPESPAENPGSPLGPAMELASYVLKRRSLIVIVSDFMTTLYAQPMAKLARRHDLMAIIVKDKLDSEVPRLGFSLYAADSESGKNRLVVPHSAAYIKNKETWYKKNKLDFLLSMSAAKLNFLELDAQSDPVERLIAFFSHSRVSS